MSLLVFFMLFVGGLIIALVGWSIMAEEVNRLGNWLFWVGLVMMLGAAFLPLKMNG